MSTAHILVTADMREAANDLTSRLLPQAGYSVTLADNFSPPPPVDLILVDITQLRGDPLSGLAIQRELGCSAPAILCAPRLTGEMAANLFPLDVRGFIRKPVSDEQLLQELGTLIEQVRQRDTEESLRYALQTTQAALTRRLDEMNALSRIGRAISSLRDVETILSRILEASVYLTQADTAAVFLHDATFDRLTLRAHHGMDAEHLQYAMSPSADSDAVQVFLSGQAQMRSGGEQAKIATDYLPTASITTPIITGKTVVGVLAVHREKSNAPFDDGDQVITASLADYTAVALNKATQIDQAEHQIDAALIIARNIRLHAETLMSPIEGIEAQVKTLLSGGFDPLTETQRAAITRIQQAIERLLEIAGFIDAELAEFDSDLSSE
jgi:two-component system NtrC family sensor kinase